LARMEVMKVSLHAAYQQVEIYRDDICRPTLNIAKLWSPGNELFPRDRVAEMDS
jgi:hypothetical protein